MSDEEWAFFEHFILAVRAQNGRKPTNHRLVLDGIFWIARTGAPWRDLPGEFGKWSSVYRQFRRWRLAGLWEDITEALNQSGAVPSALQMIDITVIRAHHPLPDRALREQCPDRETAGAKGGLHDRVSAFLERPVGKRSAGSFSGPPPTLRPRSTSSSMHTGVP
ncbi:MULTISPECIES: IS5 family transposase [Pseudooceanicola]|uniref:IS5 family transposase n=1 Tax=Pseudooceanicola TaxID=1679449 RepID=UPI0022A6F4C2|nr:MULTISPECIES: IS5 family transposase [Pseudooceanicola]